MNPSAKPKPELKLIRLLASLAFAIAAFDICLWKVKVFGCSVAVFVALLAGLIVANREGWSNRRSTCRILALLAGALIATVIEPCTSNTLVWLSLLVALAGNSYFTAVQESWGRWLSQGVALLRAPGRVFWLFRTTLEALFHDDAGSGSKVAAAGLIVLPALVLTLVFGALLASGNAIFDFWSQGLWKDLGNLFDLDRIILWILVGVPVLSLLRPVDVSPWWWSWTQCIPRLHDLAPTRHLILSSGLTLLVLNLLFLVANGADAVFLWHGQSLPHQVTYSQFVHSGVDALTWTVLLSAIVLVIIFQQSREVVRHRGLRWLAFLWVAQNLFLIFSVGLRLVRYIEAYDMTVTRLSVIFFLLLVAIGYGFLACKIAQDRSLSWLLGACILSAFGVLYVAQFLDLSGWSAEYNVACWERSSNRRLDVCYLESLGPAGWPALRRAYDWVPSDREIDEAISFQQRLALEDDEKSWREWTLRMQLNRWAMDDRANK